MGTIRGFNGILVLLAVQFALLVLVASDNMRPAWSGAPMLAGSAVIAGHMLTVAAILALLWAAWSALLDTVEIYWGTSAKMRVRRWMLPALLLAAAVFASGAIMIFALSSVSSGGVWLFRVTETSLLLPIAATALLIVSAVRRRRSARAGVVVMRRALGCAGISANLKRIEASIEWEDKASGTSVRASPQGFTFAGLTSKPWHDPAQFDWMPSFVDAVDALRAEAETVLARHDHRIERYHYVGLDGAFWRNFSFVKRHEEIPENLALCPVTADLLTRIPGYPGFRDAMFSIIAAKGVIRPHRDVSNVFLTLHLPLILSGGGYIEVGGIKREWRYGEPLVFDSSYAHEAANMSDGPRVVLLVDFPHPDLTVVERDWMRASRI